MNIITRDSVIRTPMKTYALIAALALALPGVAEARKVSYYSDRDRDGHYVKRTANVPDYNHGGRYYGGYRGGYYGGYRGGYYGGYPRYYGSGYRYGYGYPYGYGYNSYYRSIPSVSFVYSSTPRYYSTPVYRTSTSLEASVQRALKRQGYYYGAVDGDIGPGSRSAIRSYQSEHGLAVTGRIDSALIRSLGF